MTLEVPDDLLYLMSDSRVCIPRDRSVYSWDCIFLCRTNNNKKFWFLRISIDVIGITFEAVALVIWLLILWRSHVCFTDAQGVRSDNDVSFILRPRHTYAGGAHFMLTV
jgi:hypothetical protein